MDVLRSALSLLERPSGPVLEDYPVDAPGRADTDEEGWSCPIPLPSMPRGETSGEQLRQGLLLELSLLKPWFEESLATRGRTAFGVSGLEPDRMTEIAGFLVDFAAGSDPSLPQGIAAEMPAALGFLADDAKAYYLEAAGAQPRGTPPAPDELNRWLFTQTRLGEVLYKVRDRLASFEEPRWRGLAIVPAAYRNRQAV